MDMNETARIADLFHPLVYKPILIDVILMTLQEFSGLNSIAFNSAEIFCLARFGCNRLLRAVLIEYYSGIQINLVLHRYRLQLTVIGNCCTVILSRT